VIPLAFERAFTFPSVKLVVAVPEEPVAVAVYVATKVMGSWNCSVNVPSALAVVSVLYDQVLPWSSFTKMCTESNGAQPVPVSVTVEPGV
jgi:hypothetical protein